MSQKLGTPYPGNQHPVQYDSTNSTHWNKLEYFQLNTKIVDMFGRTDRTEQNYVQAKTRVGRPWLLHGHDLQKKN